MRTLAWPSQEAVIFRSFHSAGVGFAVGLETSTPISEMRSRTKRGVQLCERLIQAAPPAAPAPPASFINLRRERFFGAALLTCSVLDCSDIVIRDCHRERIF